MMFHGKINYRDRNECAGGHFKQFFHSILGSQPSTQMATPNAIASATQSSHRRRGGGLG
jgi:hypothetical protein